MAEAFCSTWAPSLKTTIILTLCTDFFFTLLIDIMYSAAWGSDALVCCGTRCTQIIIYDYDYDYIFQLHVYIGNASSHAV